MILNRGKENQKIFVLDSKYYKASVTEDNYHLPGSDSIIKQIAYAEFIENKNSLLPEDVRNNLNTEEIYNAFIMPSSLSNNHLEYFGYATSDYKTSNEENAEYRKYHKIVGIKIDTKELMYNHFKSDNKIKELAEVIKEECEKSNNSSHKM